MYNKNAWKNYKDYKEIMDFCEGYKNYITFSKTERLATTKAVELLKEKGFKEFSEVTEAKAGDKVYIVNRNKNVAAFIIGKKPIVEGLRILGAHIDSPRIDFKANCFYERDGYTFANTHYYGGIKKYQWVTIPLALHGVVCKKNGEVVTISIGDNKNDPVVGISDLLIHLSQDQLQKTLANGITGEMLDVTMSSIPLEGEEKNAVKANCLKLIKEKYGVEEEDFVSAEIEVVPAGEARDYGLDRSMVMGYGHDDRCCAYTSLMALLDTENPEYTSCCILVDKEEIGSVGATGAQSLFFENAVAKLLNLCGVGHPVYNTRIAFENSRMLSSDVSAGYDPLFPEVFEKDNAAFLGKGLVFNKFTGRGGKSGSNDANPEYYAWVRNAMDENNVSWQHAELGKVDQGGGGTIAYILGNYNMNVIDAGIAVLNMHAPMEIVSKVDLYEAYKGYKAFLKA